MLKDREPGTASRKEEDARRRLWKQEESNQVRRGLAPQRTSPGPSSADGSWNRVKTKVVMCLGVPGWAKLLRVPA